MLECELKSGIEKFLKAAIFRRITHRGITLAIFLVSLGMVFQFYTYIVPSLESFPPEEMDLSGKWDLCLSDSASTLGCEWKKVSVPGNLPPELRPQLHGWLIYKKTFSGPTHCLSSQANCSVVFGEVGDTVEAQLNGTSLGRRGEFPPHEIYAKHYPARFDLSRDLLQDGENELTLIVYSLKKVQAGISRGPVAIFNGNHGFKVAQSFVAVTVFVPLLGFVGLFLIAVIASVFGFVNQSDDRKLHFYIRYCFASSLFLLSFSEIPREYLPICIAGYLHFTLRILSDWAYFELVREYYDFPAWTRKWIRPLYILVVAAFAVKFIHDGITGHLTTGGAGFDEAYVILRISFPLLLLPHTMGIIGAWRKSKQSKVPLYLFSTLLLLQIHDTLIFHGYISGSYAVKIYPFYIGLGFGLYFLERTKEHRYRNLFEQEQAMQMKQIHSAMREVAHELRAPLAGLKMGCEQLARNPGNQELVLTMSRTFPKQVDKLLQLNTAILKYSKELSQDMKLEREQVDLLSFLNSVVDEFKTLPKLAEIEIEISAGTEQILVSIDRFQMRKVFTNILTNAAEACVGTINGRVRLEVTPPTRLRSWAEVAISDNGPGIAPEIRDRLFQPFASHGKQSGIGLGLTLSKRLVEAHGGKINFHSKETGAEFKIEIP